MRIIYKLNSSEEGLPLGLSLHTRGQNYVISGTRAHIYIIDVTLSNRAQKLTDSSNG